MIIMLQPEQVSAFWDLIKHGVVVANNVKQPNAQRYCNKVLENILAGKAQVWLGYTTPNGEKQFHAFALTLITEDELSGEKRLYIHTLYATRLISPDMWQQFIPMLEEFGRQAGCEHLYTLTTHQKIKDIVVSFGFGQNPALYVKEI